MILILGFVIGWIIISNRHSPEQVTSDRIQREFNVGNNPDEDGIRFIGLSNNIARASITNDRIVIRVRNSDLDNNDYYDYYSFSRDFVMLQDIHNHNNRVFEYFENNSVAIRVFIEARLREQLLPTIEESPNDIDHYLTDEAIDKATTALKNGFLIEYRLNDRFAGNFWRDAFPTILIFIILIGGMSIVLMIMMSRQKKEAMGFSKSKTTNQIKSKIRFTDVAGAEEEKVELAELVEFLKSPAKFTAVGAKIPRGVLLVGPPGTGKTLFAKAVAGEAEVPFFSISGSDFVEMFVGVGASRVRDLFEQAKRAQPCIIFIDEIDAVGRQRGAGLGGGHDEREQTLNQLLVQMDGFETNHGVIVIAATNRADILDPALLRPGRFDRQIFVNVPDVRGREAIFKVHARNKPLSPDIDFKAIARITSGSSGADIANILNEAAILCARDNRTLITQNDIFEGITKAMMGPQKKSRVVTEFDKRVTAYHEAGHAIVAKTCKTGFTVHEVSIIPRGRAGGYTMNRPENDNRMTTLSAFKADIAMTMGGRAAEVLVIEDVTTGAVSDIQVATNIAKKMVTEWGMSGNPKIGQVNYNAEQEVFLGKSYASSQGHSEEMSAEIDKEVTKLVEEGYQKAISVLTTYRSQMDVMARVLLEAETIFAEEVDMIMAGKSCEEVKTALEERFKKKEAEAEKAVEEASESDVFGMPV